MRSFLFVVLWLDQRIHWATIMRMTYEMDPPIKSEGDENESRGNT